MSRDMTHTDREEIIAAHVERFRAGEFGPLTFRSNLEQLGVSRDEIDRLRTLHLDECARNMRNGL